MQKRNRIFSILSRAILIAALTLILIPATVTSAAQSDNKAGYSSDQVASGNPWNAQFFNNRTFTGPVVATLTYPAGPLQNDWQYSAPASGVIADGWSARFTRVVNFPTGGQVRFEAKADDTVTVYVDGVVVTASASYFVDTTYSSYINLSPGFHTVTVDYTDIVAQAYVFVNWSGGGSATTSPTGVVGTVNDVSLNFRAAPSVSANKIGVLASGTTYAIFGRDFSGTWAYMEANGVRGWSYATYLTISGNFNALPVVAGSGTTPPTVPVGTVVANARPIYNLVIRSCASTGCSQIGLVPWQVQVDVFGQSSDGQWIYIRYTSTSGNVVIGWSYKSYYHTADDLAQPLPNLPVVQ